MTFLVSSGKIMFLFPKNMILHLRRKMKDHLCQNNTRKYDILFKLQTSNYLLQRWPFQKGLRWEMISCIIWKDDVFFPENMTFFSLGRKWDMTFLKKFMEIWYFLCTRTGIADVVSRTSAKKNQRWSHPAKIHLKVIDVLDWHPRKSSSNSLLCTFVETFTAVFMYFSPAKKPRKPNI